MLFNYFSKLTGGTLVVIMNIVTDKEAEVVGGVGSSWILSHWAPFSLGH